MSEAAWRDRVLLGLGLALRAEGDFRPVGWAVRAVLVRSMAVQWLGRVLRLDAGRAKGLMIEGGRVSSPGTCIHNDAAAEAARSGDSVEQQCALR